MHVLLAEDDPFLLKLCAERMRENGFSVESALNGEEVIVALEKRIPDILLLDLFMPKVDGFGVLQHVKERQHTFPIIILSNVDVELNLYREYGVVGYFIKSDLDFDRLAENIRTLLKKP